MAKPAKKPAAPKFSSFKGTFKFPKLNEPDYGTEKYPSPDGVYSLKLVGEADDEEVKAFLAKLAPLHEEAVRLAKEQVAEMPIATRKKLEKSNGKDMVQVNDLFTEVYDKETEEPTGEIEVKFSMTASGTYKKGPKEGKKWTRKPAIFDAKGKEPMKNPPAIWGGTVGRVSFEASPYFVSSSGACGLSLRLQAVRIIDLVSAGDRDAASYGFEEEEEGGYEHDDTAPAKENAVDKEPDEGADNSANEGEPNPDF